MRGRLEYGILATLILFACSSAAQSPTADDIIEKYLKAIGGRDLLSKLDSRVMKGTVSVNTPAGEVSGTMEVYNKAPNKSRTFMKLNLGSFGVDDIVVDQRFDGESGYSVNSAEGDRDIVGGQLHSLRNNRFPTPLLTYKTTGTKIELAGREKIGDRDAYLLEVTPLIGAKSRLYFDAENYLLLRSVVKIDASELGGEIEQTIDFSDYRDLDGVKVAYRMKVSNPAQSFTFNIGSVEHNTRIEDSNFTKPADK